MARVHRLLVWPAALYIAGILLWYEQYKLTGNPGSVWLSAAFILLSYRAAIRTIVASPLNRASLASP
jgi:hypothetical protein